MVDRVRYTGVLSHTLVSEIDLAVIVNCDILEKRITTDSVVNIGLALLVEIDNFCIAATLEVEDAVVVPAVLVVTDKQTLRVGRESGFAGT